MADPYIGVVNLIAACSLGKALQKQSRFLQRAPRRHGVDGEGSSWTLEDVASRCLVVELPKLDDAIVWASLLDGRSREEIEDELAMQFGREMEE